jgi:hypothetical protein
VGQHTAKADGVTNLNTLLGTGTAGRRRQHTVQHWRVLRSQSATNDYIACCTKAWVPLSCAHPGLPGPASALTLLPITAAGSRGAASPTPPG